MTDKLKLLPREATLEMLKAMDECSMEGYDERLYAGHAGSVYMAAWDAFHGQHCYCGDITNLGVIHRDDGPCHYPEHTSEYKRGYADAMNWKVQNHLEHLPAAQPEQRSDSEHLEPVTTFDEVWDSIEWDKWRMEPIRELCRMIISKTTPPQRKPLTDEQARSEFEAWHKDAYTQSLERYGHTYKNHHTRCRWQGWLAAHGIKE